MFGISVFGDSITFGRGDFVTGGWCGLLKKYFESKDYYNCLFNLGICGETSTRLLKRFDIESKVRMSHIRKGDRNVIILAIGINDSRLLGLDEKPETDITLFEKNIMSLIETAQTHTHEVLCIGLTPVDESLTMDYQGQRYTNERIKEYNYILKQTCIKKNIPFFDIFTVFLNLDYKYLLDDGIHPNKEGYTIMFEYIKDFLIQEKILT